MNEEGSVYLMDAGWYGATQATIERRDVVGTRAALDQAAARAQYNQAHVAGDAKYQTLLVAARDLYATTCYVCGSSQADHAKAPRLHAFAPLRGTAGFNP